MKIVHYTPSLDRTWGGTAFYMQLLTKELGRLVELHVASHASMNELMMEHCTVHRLSSWKNNSVETGMERTVGLCES